MRQAVAAQQGVGISLPLLLEGVNLPEPLLVDAGNRLELFGREGLKAGPIERGVAGHLLLQRGFQRVDVLLQMEKCRGSEMNREA